MMGVRVMGSCCDADALAARLAAAVPCVPGLSDLEFGSLSAVGRIDALRASEVFLRCAQAVNLQALAALDRAARAERGGESGMTESEVQAAIRWPISTVKNRLAQAGQITRRLPEALAALAVGEVSWEQTRALSDLTNCMSEEHARAVQERVLPHMPTQGYVSTRRAVRTAIHAVDPDGAAKRHVEEKKNRRVVV